MKFRIRLMICFVLIFFIFCLAASVQAKDKTDNIPKESVTPEYIAEVNGIQISQDELDRKLNLILNRYESTGMQLDEKRMSGFRKSIANSLVDQELLFQECAAEGIVVSKEEVNAELEGFKKQFETEAEYAQQLSEMDHTETLLKSQIEKTRAIRQLIENKVLSQINISNKQAKAYYDSHPEEFKVPDRVHARHILVKVDRDGSEKDKQDALKKVQGIKDKLDNGVDFTLLAAENSECPSSEKGGDLGYFPRGRMVKPFEETAFSMKPGDISGIVETEFGFHIIKVEAKEIEATMKYNDIKENLKQKLKQDRFKEALPDYIATLREKADVEMFIAFPDEQSDDFSDLESGGSSENDQEVN